MKNFFKLPILSLLSIALISGTPTLSLAKNNNQNADTIKVNLYTETVDVFDKNTFKQVFTNDDIKFLKESLNSEITYSNESVTITMKTKIKPSTEQGLVLYADGNPVDVNSDGSIEVTKSTKKISKLNENHNSDHSNSDISSHNEHSDSSVSDSFYNADIININSNESEVVFKVSSGELLAKMDEIEDEYIQNNSSDILDANLSDTPRKGYGDKYYTGDSVHCNRFNGHLTDDVHYNWRTGSVSEKAAAMKNFYSSDCHVALIQAGSGCTSIGSCNCNTTQKAAYCSGFVRDNNTGANCPYTYHKHSGTVIPR